MNQSDRYKIIERVLKRRTQITGSILPSIEAVTERLTKESNLSFYLGIDPTNSQIHLGHTIPLLLLRDLVDLGHKAIVLIGDFTARIGDPTDKNAARTELSQDQVENNMAGYVEQIKRVMAGRDFEVRYNSEWLESMTLGETLKLASLATVQQMLARDMFQERQKQGKPIYISEFMYPLMQGYDSVAMRIDGEVGGSDQTFNMLVGRDLAEKLLGKNKMVIATSLLVDATSGRKMSKTEGGFISLTDSPQEIRRKVLAYIPNEMIEVVFRLCTDKDDDWIIERTEQAKNKKDWKGFQEELADALITMYYSQEAIVDSHEAEEVKVEANNRLDQVLYVSGATESTSASRRIIQQGGVSIDGEKVTRWDVTVAPGKEIKIGKGKKIKIAKN